MEVEEVKVELGFIAVRVVMSEALADRIPSTQALRSSSFAKATIQPWRLERKCNRYSHACNAKEEWGLRISNL